MPDSQTVLIANPGADLYGSDRMVLEAVRALIATGLRVVVTVPTAGPLCTLLEGAGAEVVRCPTPIVRRSMATPRGLVALVGEAIGALRPSLSLLRRSGAGTVIVNTVTAPFWLALARLLGRRALCYVHEAEASTPRPIRLALYGPLLLCHRIVANSLFTKDVLTETLPVLRRRIVAVPNTVPGPDAVQQPRERLDSPVRLLYVGRLSERKGVRVAVRALARVRAGGLDATLDIVGAVFPGNEAFEESLRELVDKLALADVVTFSGFRSPVWNELARCDVAVVPAILEESFGNTAVEAALAARPCVVSAIGGLKEAAESNQSAILVEPNDEEALADAIRTVVTEWPRYRAAAIEDSRAGRTRHSFDTYATRFSAAVANPTTHSGDHS